MHQVLIVDDELRDRNIIKILLERRYAGQFCFLEAENGTRALKILSEESVELLLLDINMPGVSGLDVLHNLKCMPYVIILTAYDSFEYTREALRCGVRDYLLKPPLRQEFYKAVDHFLEDCERIQENLTPQIQSKEVFTRDLARQLMYFGDTKKIRGLLNVLDIERQYALCGILRCEEDSSENLDSALDEAEDLLERWGVQYAAAACSSGLAIFLFCEGEDASDALQLLTGLSHNLESNLCIEVQVQTGPLAPVFRGYPKSFLELLDYEKSGAMALLTSVQQSELENAVRCKDFPTAMRMLQPMLEYLDRANGHEDILKYQLLLALSQCTRQVLSGKAATEAYHRISGLISAQGREQATAITARYLEWLVHEAAGRDVLRNNAVQAVLDRVREDYSYPWSIAALAETLHVNACYLSHLFKENVGQCFTEYLAECRVNHAVELIRTTNLSLSQIGEKVGYSDPNYFSRVFKKKMGIGPREFLKRLRSGKS